MEKVWELKEGSESYGSVKGGIGKERVRFTFQVEKGGYFYFVCSLPYALNEKGSVMLDKWKLQDSQILRRFSKSSQSRFSIDVRLRVFNKYKVIHVKEMVLDIAGIHDRFECFEIPSGFTPATVELEIEGHSFLRKLKLAAELHRYGSAPRNPEEKQMVSKLAQFLLTSTMKQGEGNYEETILQEKQKLMSELHNPTLFAVPPPEPLARSASGGSTQSLPNAPVVFEVQASDSIGNAMFILLEKGILSAPVWDAVEEKYLGIFDIQDAMHFTLKLREMSMGKSHTRRKGDFLIHGVTVGESESSSWYGLDLPVAVFFREENRWLAPWVPLRIASPMKKVLEALSSDTQRVPVVDNDGRVVKIISQSEIINQVFFRYIKPKLEPRKKEYFETTELNEIAVEEGVKPYCLNDSVFKAFNTLMASTKIDALPIVDTEGVLVASLTPVDSWFLCRTELEEEGVFLDLNSMTVKEFLEHARDMSCRHLAKKRKDVVRIAIDTPLRETISLIVRHKVHGCFICDEQNRPIGRINVAQIVTALLVDDVGIFQPHENIASVFLWEKNARKPRRPSVTEVVKQAAARSKQRRTGEDGEPISPPEPEGQKAKANEDSEEVLEEARDSFSSHLVGMSVEGSIGQAAKRKGTMLRFPSFSRRSTKFDDLRFVKGSKDIVLTVAEQSAVEKHLPAALQGGRWTLAYSMRRDGASTLALTSMLSQDAAPLVVALQDAEGYKFGGFLPSGVYLDEMANENSYTEGPNGDGESFVYTFGSSRDHKLRVYRWSGKNRHFRFASASRGFGMGGGGNGFAFYVDNFMLAGMSRESATYENSCLASKEEFSCVNMDFYSISTSLKAPR